MASCPDSGAIWACLERTRSPAPESFITEPAAVLAWRLAGRRTVSARPSTSPDLSHHRANRHETSISDPDPPPRQNSAAGGTVEAAATLGTHIPATLWSRCARGRNGSRWPPPRPPIGSPPPGRNTSLDARSWSTPSASLLAITNDSSTLIPQGLALRGIPAGDHHIQREPAGVPLQRVGPHAAYLPDLRKRRRDSDCEHGELLQPVPGPCLVAAGPGWLWRQCCRRPRLLAARGLPVAHSTSGACRRRLAQTPESP